MPASPWRPTTRCWKSSRAICTKSAPAAASSTASPTATPASPASRGIHVIRMPEHYGRSRPSCVIPLQLLAYHTALRTGIDVDKPLQLSEERDRRVSRKARSRLYPHQTGGSRRAGCQTYPPPAAHAACCDRGACGCLLSSLPMNISGDLAPSRSRCMATSVALLRPIQANHRHRHAVRVHRSAGIADGNYNMVKELQSRRLQDRPAVRRTTRPASWRRSKTSITRALAVSVIAAIDGKYR